MFCSYPHLYQLTHYLWFNWGLHINRTHITNTTLFFPAPQNLPHETFSGQILQDNLNGENSDTNVNLLTDLPLFSVPTPAHPGQGETQDYG